ncbi:MAG: EAL domain-containing protein [Planctomycetales bacterium]|nr:EAL domain-containing protein [Planctomycetales bacterium]
MLRLPQQTKWSSYNVTAFFSSNHHDWEDVLREVSAGYDVELSAPHEGVTAVHCSLSTLKTIADQLRGCFSSLSQEKIVCHVSDNAEASIAKMMHTRNLSELHDWLEAHWVRQIISERRLTTFFQPVIHCSSMSVFGYECLMRGIEPGEQVISPLRLISAARKSGQLQKLDELARIIAIENAASLDVDDVAFFINFSPRYMTRQIPGMQETVDAALESGIPTERFVFEIIESDEIDDIEFVADVLNLLREAGFRIALDDIGAGYNSLTRIADIRPDFIKVDMDLIRNVHNDPFKGCVTSKLLELARELGIATIVEGVETEDEWEWAKSHGADYAQGFYFAMPSPNSVGSTFDVRV